jgi:hypothetical protein
MFSLLILTRKVQLFSEIIFLFGNTVVNKLEALLDSEFTKRGRIEHHFYAMKSVSIVFVEVKEASTMGMGRLDIIAQVLAECASMFIIFFFFTPTPDFHSNAYNIACDYVNAKVQHWVPVLAILCDGDSFEFLVYDSGIKSIYSSGVVTGLWDKIGEPEYFILSIKKSK